MLERPERLEERFPLVQDPPFSLEGTRAFLFVVPCDRERVDLLLDRTFGWARPAIDLRSAAPYCLVVFTDVARASARDPELGWFAYKEAAVFVPVWGEREGAPDPFFALHVPFIWPSEGLAVAAGREIYGLPKKPGRLDVPSGDAFWSGGAQLSLRTLAAERFDGSGWAERSLLTVESDPHPTLLDRLEDELLDALAGVMPPLPVPIPGAARLLRQDLIQLKQVPDTTTGGTPPRALYRAVTRVEAPVRRIADVKLGDASRVRLRVASLASEPLRDVLGLGEVVTPRLAASLTMDFRFEAGEVWREEPRAGAAPRRKTKVLVLGGGMSALAAAHALTDSEARRDRFDVHVLTQGHLLGGKGASTRNPAAGERNEEHGIHVLFGFYHNALRLLRQVYVEAARAPGEVWPATFADAFRPEHGVVFHDGERHREILFPELPEGHGAGPQSIADQLRALESFAAQVAGGPLSSVVASALLPGQDGMGREILAFVAILLKGVFEDVVVRGKSWDELDAQDFREWMRSHRLPGLPDVTHAAIMQVPYDGVFAYEGPDQARPRISAGVTARGLLKLATDYEVAPYFAMTAGMGECVFAPLYEVLRRRGVRFEMFAKVKELHLEAGRATRVVYGRQAEVRAGAEAYEPIRTIGALPTWRAAPDDAQLVGAAPADPYSDAATDQVGADRELRVGADFDWVVCTLPAPVTAGVLRGHEHHPALAAIARIPTVATLHLQTWFNDPCAMLGWTYRAQVLGGFPQPLNSMHLRDPYLGVESWIGPRVPRGLVYLSGPFGGGWSTDAKDPAARDAAATAAHAEARAFVQNEYWRALPIAKAGSPPRFDPTTLFAPATPADPMADQYVRWNIDASARYVLMRPGGLQDRPPAVPSGVSNLRLAGDWTRNGIDIPCIEGAVVSALQAASSILGEDLDVLW